MNGAAFANLPQLVMVNLRGNVCIDKYFTPDNDLKASRRKISRNCVDATDAARKEISCTAAVACVEDMGQFYMDLYNKTPGCCEVEHGINIDSPDYSFVADANYANLEIIYISYQPNIEFLPVLIHESFPHLKMYSASVIPVQKITKRNFEKLFELEVLFLVKNRIEVIKGDTFEDLINLKRIIISR